MNTREVRLPEPTRLRERVPTTHAPYVVRRVVARARQGAVHRNYVAARHYLAAARWRSQAVGYGSAVAGVALASGIIGIILHYVRFSNISLVYLLVVLGLAAAFGRGPAVLASVLAFLAYDFYFIPPLHVLTVDDPTEWISLFALLAASLIAGQLTAVVRARAREARESERRTATLYALSQLIVTTTERDALLRGLADNVARVFAPSGVAACALVLPDERGSPVTAATAPAGGPFVRALSLTARERFAEASLALRQGTAAGHTIGRGGSPDAAQDVVLYVPLLSSGRVVGALGVAGGPEIRRLVSGVAAHATRGAGRPDHSPGDDPQVALFAAFCDQIALALDHLALERAAIHTEALRESDQLKNALLGSVTHDLRTPLASIQAAASSLLDEEVAWSAADRRAFAETIETSAERLGRLVSNLLDLSRLEAGVAVPEKSWYPIGDVIATVLDRLDLAGRTTGRGIEVDVPADLPPVSLDHAQIEQVLTNLVENALKYSPQDSVVRVSARVRAPGEGASRELEVRVRDEGIGIPANELEAIFGKFYRIEHVELPWAAGRPPVGTGLGLAICAGIVAAHGGRIWAESTVGEGSTFIFSLPLSDDGSRAEPPERAAEAARASGMSEAEMSEADMPEADMPEADMPLANAPTRGAPAASAIGTEADS